MNHQYQLLVPNANHHHILSSDPTGHTTGPLIITLTPSVPLFGIGTK